jgi:hypothetical protein
VFLSQENCLGGGSERNRPSVSESDRVCAAKRIYAPQRAVAAAPAGPDEVAGEVPGDRGRHAIECSSVQDGLMGERQVGPREGPERRGGGDVVEIGVTPAQDPAGGRVCGGKGETPRAGHERLVRRLKAGGWSGS